MPGQEQLTVFAGDELCDLRRDEARELGTLPTASIRRAFAIAIAAWSAKVWAREMCSSVNDCASLRTTTTTPIKSSSIMTGTPSIAR